MKNSINKLLIILVSSSIFFVANNLNASSLSNSVLNTPDGTTFKLNYELKVPAKSNFIQLGESSLDGLLNDIAKTGNQFEAGYSVNTGYSRGHSGYSNFNTYSGQLLESAEQAYQRCLQGYQRTYQTNRNYNQSNTTVINNWGNNSNVTVNNRNQYQQPSYGTYTAPNTCQPPNYSMSALVINPRKAKSGGIFREGYEFQVSNVRHRRHGRFHKVYIDFDHDVAEGIVIITTHSPRNMPLHLLSSSRQNSDTGFWGALAAGLASMGDVAGNKFSISLPEDQYFD